EIKSRVIDRGCNFAFIRPHVMGDDMGEYFIKWAKYLAENKIYFHFGYNTGQMPKPGKPSIQIDKETTEKIKEIAGEYFLGIAIGEAGSSYACKAEGYFRKREGRNYDGAVQKTDATDMRSAYGYYSGVVKGLVGKFKDLGMPSVLCVDSTTLLRYNIEAGVDIPMLELMCGEPEAMLAVTRGSAGAYGKDFWGTLIAHEWYGGTRHDDMLKRKRFELANKLAYISGARCIMLESGDESINSYGHKYSSDSHLCAEYSKAFCDTVKLIKNDERPHSGPKVKVAFVQGRYDAWGGYGQSSIYNQFNREEWGHGDAEYSWRMLDNIGVKRKWADNANYGDSDLSSVPAYGQYDIIPIEADVDALSKYDRLIFLGWSSMTDEDMDKLTEYVRRGGKLLLSAAHLNYSVKRSGEYVLPNEKKLEELCGCRFVGDSVRTNAGTKFDFESLDPQILYPGTKTFVCDPIYSAGYNEYMKTEVTSGKIVGHASDCFWNDPPVVTTVIENKVGEGVVTLVTSKDYPGNPAVYPLYSTIVREFITASGRNCEIKVISSDKLRYSVYDSKIYLLNTDYDLPIVVKVICGDREELLTLDSLELKSLTYEME
ncbi:MAG: hypothetical protein IKV16_06240, partial [Clostridia bacterium]|nr:hypothetical protein [Clostridia bacterium]